MRSSDHSRLDSHLVYIDSRTYSSEAATQQHFCRGIWHSFDCEWMLKTKKARVINAAWQTGGGVFHITVVVLGLVVTLGPFT